MTGRGVCAVVLRKTVEANFGVEKMNHCELNGMVCNFCDVAFLKLEETF